MFYGSIEENLNGESSEGNGNSKSSIKFPEVKGKVGIF